MATSRAKPDTLAAREIITKSAVLIVQKEGSSACSASNLKNAADVFVPIRKTSGALHLQLRRVNVDDHVTVTLTASLGRPTSSPSMTARAV